MEEALARTKALSSDMYQPTRLLSVYLLIASLLQIALYVALTDSTETFGNLFYIDPRIGMFFIESGIRGHELTIPGIGQWLSASWLLLIAFTLLSGRLTLKTYIVSEIILSLPNLLFVVVIVVANLSPVHGFSIAELLFPIIVMILFSIIPLLLALFFLFLRHRRLLPHAHN